MAYNLNELLHRSSARHNHLCPRQVLGVRMGLAGLEALGLDAPVSKQIALVIVETDGCFADGIEVATGATIGHRTLRVNDLGKIAATFTHIKSGCTIRLSPAIGARQRAHGYAPTEQRHYFAQLQGYQFMSNAELFRYQHVTLHPSLEYLLSKPNARVECDLCGEEIINERQIQVANLVLCLTCAKQSYYEPIDKTPEIYPLAMSGQFD